MNGESEIRVVEARDRVEGLLEECTPLHEVESGCEHENRGGLLAGHPLLVPTRLISFLVALGIGAGVGFSQPGCARHYSAEIRRGQPPMDTRTSWSE